MKKLFILFIAVAGFGISGFAQSYTTTSSTATLIAPISIEAITPLNFGTVAASETVGTVDIDYANVVTLTTGDVQVITSSGATTAVFRVTGSGTLAFGISGLPTEPITLAVEGGSAGVTVGNFICDEGDDSALVGGTKDLKVKAQLTVPANAVPGVYLNTADFTITVNYN